MWFPATAKKRQARNVASRLSWTRLGSSSRVVRAVQTLIVHRTRAQTASRGWNEIAELLSLAFKNGTTIRGSNRDLPPRRPPPRVLHRSRIRHELSSPSCLPVQCNKAPVSHPMLLSIVGAAVRTIAIAAVAAPTSPAVIATTPAMIVIGAGTVAAEASAVGTAVTAVGAEPVAVGTGLAATVTGAAAVRAHDATVVAGDVATCACAATSRAGLATGAAGATSVRARAAAVAAGAARRVRALLQL